MVSHILGRTWGCGCSRIGYRERYLDLRGRELHNEKLLELCCSPDNVRMVMSRMRLTGHAVRTGEKRNTYRALIWTAEDGDVDGM